MDDTLVKFSDIHKSYPGKDVLKGVSFEIKRGTVHGFLGPNGAGKSTLMNLLLGELELNRGEIKFLDDVRIGYLPEHLPLYENMKVEKYLQFVQDIYDKRDQEYLDHIISKCGLIEVSKRQISHLSKGYKQRVALAQCLCHKPELLVLDEPMVGLDPHAVMKMKELILELSKKHTIFISSHQLHELSQVCSHISIINKGVVVKSGSIEEIESDMNQNQVVEVELQESVSQVVLEDFLSTHSLLVENKNSTTYQFTSEGQEDLRLLLGQFFAKNGLTVLSQSIKKMNLEEIFKSSTSGEGQ